MNDQYPKLVFVSGPQAGQRVTLAHGQAVLGRGAGSDILLSEEFVSRQQARYELLRGGPAFENLSAAGTWVNGRRYKAGKKILLETGDLIGMGAQTELLFVGAGDDAEATLAEYEGRRPRPSAFGRKRTAEEQPAKEELALEAAPAEARLLDERQAVAILTGERSSSALSTDERQQAERARKRKRLYIMLGVYLAILAAGAWALSTMRGVKGGEMGVPPILVRAQIGDALDARLNRPLDAEKEKEQLAWANIKFRSYGTANVERLYAVVMAYKEALAYGGRSAFVRPADGDSYRQARDRLLEELDREYRNACALELDEKWALAEKAFKRLMSLFIGPDGLTDDSNAVFVNAKEHYNRVQYYRQKKSPQRRMPWS